MYGKEMFQKGIYGIVDLDIYKIVYVGSTNVSFSNRWGHHWLRVKKATTPIKN